MFQDLIQEALKKGLPKVTDDLEIPFSGKSSMSKSLDKWIKTWPKATYVVDKLRASQIYYTCPTEFVLNYWKPVPAKSHDLNSIMRMPVGTHLHYFLQNFIFGPMGFLEGKWENKYTKEIVLGRHPDPEDAVKSIFLDHANIWEFKEDEMWLPEHRISGHIDGKVDLEVIPDLLKPYGGIFEFDTLYKLKKSNSNVALFELKTVSDWVYDSLKSAEDIHPSYKMQACVYQYGFKIPQTLFMFLNRGSLEAKLFVYKYQEAYWITARDKANIIWNSIKNETIPTEARVCQLPTDKVAKHCPHVEDCWKVTNFKKWIQSCKESQPDRKFLTFT